MLVTTEQKLIAEYNFTVGRFRYYPNIIIGEFNEGVHVTKENAAEPIRLAKELCGTEKPLVYISHRLHSYSMDPTGYEAVTKMFPNFRGFAIVSNNRYRRMLANLERLFIKRPIRVFYDLDRAFQWAETLLAAEE
ncbi:hypothetical protein FGM00_16450 [Aggregatimonas sangjinii]|uniref:STAS/SEC14 domain-containing protein n=1 Tax=Aggregatimonas sangjinii TaxID=2583587 RepID=A0A5B7SXY2_9FLAO|nr:hypothetical protein [Aggregatimonas sangjinii]QCX01624.1 hypothetical protein FGM00_16450 [Aggregatimonas sangjinii]